VKPRPSAPSVVEDLLPITGAPRQARDIVTVACLRWQLAHLLAPAILITSELVSNVVEHAGTIMTMHVTLGSSHLDLSVHDGSTALPVMRPGGSTAPRGRGLHLIEAASTAWGCVPEKDGKTVWATLALETTAPVRRAT
jgi:hypothetical protein